MTHTTPMWLPEWWTTDSAGRPTSDPFLRPPSEADRALVIACGGTVDEQIGGAA